MTGRVCYLVFALPRVGNVVFERFGGLCGINAICC